MISLGRRGFTITALNAIFLSFGAALARDVPLNGISYNPSGMADSAKQDAGVTANRIRKDLTQIAPFTHDIRLYSVARGLAQVPAIAAPLGLKVTLGIWLGNNAKENAVEISQAIKVVRANPKAIARIVVGNETLQHGYVKSDDLIAALNAVRNGIGGMRIPIGTAEIWPVWGGARDVATACDFIGAHIIPYWDGVGLGDAAAYVAQRYDDLKRDFPDKEIVILETGWPSAGPVRQGAMPSPENQARFARDFSAFARARGITYFLVEAYDQPWKIREGDTALWGLFDLNRTPKPAALQLLDR